MIEAWGRGVRGMMDACHEVGNPTPAWRLEAGGDGLSVTFPFSDAYLAADAAVRGAAAPRTTQKTARKQPEGGNPSRGPADRILAFLRENPSASRRKIAEAIAGVTEASVRYQLDKLKSANRLRRVGPDRGGRWMVLDGDDATGANEGTTHAGGRREPGRWHTTQNRQKNSQKRRPTTRKPPENNRNSQKTARIPSPPRPHPRRPTPGAVREPPRNRRRTRHHPVDRPIPPGQAARGREDRAGRSRQGRPLEGAARPAHGGGPEPMIPIRIFISSVQREFSRARERLRRERFEPFQLSLGLRQVGSSRVEL